MSRASNLSINKRVMKRSFKFKDSFTNLQIWYPQLGSKALHQLLSRETSPFGGWEFILVHHFSRNIELLEPPFCLLCQSVRYQAPTQTHDDIHCFHGNITECPPCLYWFTFIHPSCLLRLCSLDFHWWFSEVEGKKPEFTYRLKSDKASLVELLKCRNQSDKISFSWSKSLKKL